MSKVIFDISMSLDGFIAGPNVRPEEGMGDGGERLHQWAFGEDEANREYLTGAMASLGAVIAGRRTYDMAIGWWGADGPTGPLRVPVFVVTHEAPATTPENGVYTFVTDGIEPALEQARDTAGDRTITVMGGADLGRQFIRQGLVDEISIHLVPILLGSGTPMFEEIATELVTAEVIQTPAATHLRYRVSR